MSPYDHPRIAFVCRILGSLIPGDAALSRATATLMVLQSPSGPKRLRPPQPAAVLAVILATPSLCRGMLAVIGRKTAPSEPDVSALSAVFLPLLLPPGLLPPSQATRLDLGRLIEWLARHTALDCDADVAREASAHPDLDSLEEAVVALLSVGDDTALVKTLSAAAARDGAHGRAASASLGAVSLGTISRLHASLTAADASLAGTGGGRDDAEDAIATVMAALSRCAVLPVGAACALVRAQASRLPLTALLEQPVEAIRCHLHAQAITQVLPIAGGTTEDADALALALTRRLTRAMVRQRLRSAAIKSVASSTTAAAAAETCLPPVTAHGLSDAVALSDIEVALRGARDAETRVIAAETAALEIPLDESELASLCPEIIDALIARPGSAGESTSRGAGSVGWLAGGEWAMGRYGMLPTAWAMLALRGASSSSSSSTASASTSRPGADGTAGGAETAISPSTVSVSEAFWSPDADCAVGSAVLAQVTMHLPAEAAADSVPSTATSAGTSYDRMSARYACRLTGGYAALCGDGAALGPAWRRPFLDGWVDSPAADPSTALTALPQEAMAAVAEAEARQTLGLTKLRLLALACRLAVEWRDGIAASLGGESFALLDGGEAGDSFRSAQMVLARLQAAKCAAETRVDLLRLGRADYARLGRYTGRHVDEADETGAGAGGVSDMAGAMSDGLSDAGTAISDGQRQWAGSSRSSAAEAAAAYVWREMQPRDAAAAGAAGRRSASSGRGEVRHRRPKHGGALGLPTLGEEEEEEEGDDGAGGRDDADSTGGVNEHAGEDEDDADMENDGPSGARTLKRLIPRPEALVAFLLARAAEAVSGGAPTAIAPVAVYALAARTAVRLGVSLRQVRDHLAHRYLTAAPALAPAKTAASSTPPSATGQHADSSSPSSSSSSLSPPAAVLEALRGVSPSLQANLEREQALLGRIAFLLRPPPACVDSDPRSEPVGGYLTARDGETLPASPEAAEEALDAQLQREAHSAQAAVTQGAKALLRMAAEPEGPAQTRSRALRVVLLLVPPQHVLRVAVEAEADARGAGDTAGAKAIAALPRTAAGMADLAWQLSYVWLGGKLRVRVTASQLAAPGGAAGLARGLWRDRRRDMAAVAMASTLLADAGVSDAGLWPLLIQGLLDGGRAPDALEAVRRAVHTGAIGEAAAAAAAAGVAAASASSSSSSASLVGGGIGAASASDLEASALMQSRAGQDGDTSRSDSDSSPAAAMGHTWCIAVVGAVRALLAARRVSASAVSVPAGRASSWSPIDGHPAAHALASRVVSAIAAAPMALPGVPSASREAAATLLLAGPAFAAAAATAALLVAGSIPQRQSAISTLLYTPATATAVASSPPVLAKAAASGAEEAASGPEPERLASLMTALAQSLHLAHNQADPGTRTDPASMALLTSPDARLARCLLQAALATDSTDAMLQASSPEACRAVCAWALHTHNVAATDSTVTSAAVRVVGSLVRIGQLALASELSRAVVRGKQTIGPLDAFEQSTRQDWREPVSALAAVDGGRAPGTAALLAALADCADN
jgi:hypothetical protein